MIENNKITIHNSASSFGCATLITKWHQERRFLTIGYHAVIVNGKAYYREDYDFTQDGALERGRELTEKGAHVKGKNTGNLGLCLIGGTDGSGNFTPFTTSQLRTARTTVLRWMALFDINIENVLGHSQQDHNKKCPEMNMTRFREYITAPDEAAAEIILKRFWRIK